MSKPRLPVWQIPVTHTLDQLVEEAVSKDTHVSKSDLVREAVREKLAKMGFAYVNAEPVKHGSKP
jgi:Arc/MetJ-type ribon-helix-helix transcriptional regulator